MQDSPRYALIVTVEGLGTNLVGCYGGAIAPTKNLDSFACRSIVFDQFWADTMRPVDILESMWTGSHFAARAHDPSVACHSLFERAMLITDSIDMIEESTRAEFGSVLCLDEHAIADQAIGQDPNEEEADEEQTQFGRLFVAALGQWATQRDEFPILWIHSRGLNGAWDAPYDYRCVMCDEGDPEPPEGIEPGQLAIDDDTDPDEVFGLACALGGQAMVLDDAWGMIEEVLEELGIAGECLRILAGVQGYPIGEHGWVGHGGGGMYAETLHMPLLVRPGDQLDVGIRVPFMVQPNSLLKTLLAWIGEHDEEVSSSAFSTDLISEIDAFPAEHWPIKNQLAYSCHADQIHVAVPAWSCRWFKGTGDDGAAVDAERVELFATPDDRWQQNEVSQRAQSTVDELVEYREAWLRRVVESDGTEWVALGSELTHPIR